MGTYNNKLEEEVKKVIIGKDEVIQKVIMAILAGGHILLEDLPGVGKTTLALGLSKAMGLSYRRIQFTPDVLPGDIVGFSIYNRETGAFDYKPGAVMCNVLLADEINRTFSKTQSALLEVMEEGTVTVDGVTYPVPSPFVVIATQNPYGAAGTQSLPQSQMDRFMISCKMGYPDTKSQIAMINRHKDGNPMEEVQAVLDAQELSRMRREVGEVHVSEALVEYLIRLCEATRSQGNISLGVSPRGVLALHAMTRACAYVHGRNYALPDDVKEVFPYVCAHRIVLSGSSAIQRVEANQVLELILKEVACPTIAGQASSGSAGKGSSKSGSKKKGKE